VGALGIGYWVLGWLVKPNALALGGTHPMHWVGPKNLEKTAAAQRTLLGERERAAQV